MVTSSLTGKVAVVTGGSRGIGLGIARALVAEGVHTTVTGRNEERLAFARSALASAGPGESEALPADVRDYDEMKDAVGKTVARFGGLDILVNNAGVGIFAEIADLTPAQWHDVIDTNVTGVFNTCHVALPHLRKRGGGYIINISSLAGKNAFAGGGAYCASKSALNALSEVLMQELRYDDIRVTYVMPGSVATGFSGDDESHGADWKVSSDEVAAVVLDLLRLSPRALASRVELRPAKPRKK